jgi:hypothetical protein
MDNVCSITKDGWSSCLQDKPPLQGNVSIVRTILPYNACSDLEQRLKPTLLQGDSEENVKQ